MSATHGNFLVQDKKCKHCKKKVVSALDCVICNSSFHPSCAYQARVVDKSEKVVCCLPSQESEVESDKPLEDQQDIKEMDEKIRTTIQDTLGQFLKPFRKTMEKEMAEVKTSVQYMSNLFEEQKGSFEEILKEFRALKKENTALKERVKSLETRIMDLEQNEKARNIVVVGVPKQNNMGPERIVKQIGKGLNVPLADADIEETYTLSKQESGPILVKLRSLGKKQEIIRKVKQRKGLTLNECGLEGGGGKIFLNDDLTSQKRLLFKKARDAKKSGKFRIVYCLNGKIFAKKDGEDRPIQVFSEDDLN